MLLEGEPSLVVAWMFDRVGRSVGGRRWSVVVGGGRSVGGRVGFSEYSLISR